MEPEEDDPRTTEQASVTPANDRRRPGRPEEVSLQLRALLRGQTDPSAPADPVVPLPPAKTVELVIGALAIMALLLAGAAFRFAI